MFALIGVLAAGIKMIGDAGLVLGLWRRHFRQHRFTWLLFTLTAWVFLKTQLDMGASWSQLFFWWILVVNVVLLALTLTPGRGEGGTEGKSEWIALGIALCSVALLFVTDSPLVALFATMVADLIGCWYSIKRAWNEPVRAEATPWLYGTIGSALSVLAVGAFDWRLLIAPLYFLAFDGAMFCLSRFRSLPQLCEPVPARELV